MVYVESENENMGFKQSEQSSPRHIFNPNDNLKTESDHIEILPNTFNS